MENQENELRLEGRHSVMEAFRAGKLIERLFVLKGCQDGPVLSILREAKKAGVMVDFVPKERLDHMSESGKHQGVVANLSAFRYSTVEDMFALAEKRGSSIPSNRKKKGLKIRITSERSSEPQTLPAHMV